MATGRSSTSKKSGRRTGAPARAKKAGARRAPARAAGKSQTTSKRSRATRSRAIDPALFTFSPLFSTAYAKRQNRRAA